MTPARPSGLALALLLAASAAGAADDVADDSCVACHAEEEDEMLSDPVPEWRASVHAEAEVSCDGCHGGDPHAEDPDEAHDEAAGWVGTPPWRELADFCGACHESIAEAYGEGAFGAGFHGGVFPPSCASCHMATGHETKRARVRDVLPAELPERLRGFPVLEAAREALGPIDERTERTAARVAALARRALPPSGLDVALAAVREDWAPRLHHFDADSLRAAERVAHEGLAAVEARAGALEIEAGVRGRMGVVALAGVSIAIAALAAARRVLLR